MTTEEQRAHIDCDFSTGPGSDQCEHGLFYGDVHRVGGIVFGQSLPCPECGGTGNGPLDQHERSKELRMAKKRREEPPPIHYPPCSDCRGTGLTTDKLIYR